MDQKNNFYLIMSLMDMYTGNSYFKQNLSLDSNINDCLIYMYFYMLSGDIKYYHEFNYRYDKLNISEQEFVKNDYINIIKAQDEKEKVKKKER